VLRGKKPATTRKRTRESDDLSYPRYLTAKSLLEHEIADQQFRRQILLQYFILFQFLLSLTPATVSKQQFTGGMPKSFVVDGADQKWVKGTVQLIRDELKRMEPDGLRFEETVVQLMNRERRYVSSRVQPSAAMQTRALH
jgi:THO complex subunit 1